MRQVDELRRLSDLLDQALDLPADERPGWLDALARQDAGLAQSLREMLARHADDSAAALLDTSAASRLLVGSDTSEDPALRAGQSIGPYRLLSPIGSGGMGEVWLASPADQGPDRRVALKLPVLSTRRGVLLQRFERERNILASLTHPNIARLYDAGVSDDGQPYLALEHVDGVAITRYCEERRLDTTSRVRLMLQVMEAVQHAHARLVIHRDLKPGNVLVTAEGRAMLLDFGIAKLLQGEDGIAEETALTREGGRAMTLDYAAPEQLRGEAVSTATDVWALGVVSYELLAGHRPFRGTRRGEVEQRVLDADPPRLTLSPTTAQGPRRSRLQEIETILGKAMKKRPEDRYATVAAFADDLNRWLRDEPVLARPDSNWYRASKLVVRHRGAVAVSVAVLAAVLGAAGVAVWQSQLAREQAQVARTEAATARAVQDFLEGILRTNRNGQPDPMAARDKTARQLLEEAAVRISGSLDDEPQAKLRLLATLADMLEDVERRDIALRMLEQRAELIGRMAGEASDAHVNAVLDAARRMLAQKRQAEAEVLIDQASALQRLNPKLKASTLETMALLRGAGASGSAAPASAIADIVRLLDQAGTAKPTLDAVLARHALTTLQRRAGDADAAQQSQRKTFQALAQLDLDGLSSTRRVLLDQVRRAADAGRDVEAMDMLASIQPVSDSRLGSPLLFTMLTPDAHRLIGALNEEMVQQFGHRRDRSDAVPGLYYNAQREQARAQLLAGRIADARQVTTELERAARNIELLALRSRAEVSVELGELDEAKRVMGVLKERLGPSAKPAGLVVINMYLQRDARMLLEESIARGDPAAARAVFDQLVPSRPSGFDADVAAFDARLLLLEGKATEAVAVARPAIDTLRIRRPSASRIQLHQTLGEALVAIGQPAEAIPVLEAGLTLVPSVYEPELSPRVALLHLALAEARFASGDRAAARQSLETGEAILAKHPQLGPQYLGPLARAKSKVGAG